MARAAVHRPGPIRRPRVGVPDDDALAPGEGLDGRAVQGDDGVLEVLPADVQGKLGVGSDLDGQRQGVAAVGLAFALGQDAAGLPGVQLDQGAVDRRALAVEDVADDEGRGLSVVGRGGG